jgi:hypothetical protein
VLGTADEVGLRPRRRPRGLDRGELLAQAVEHRGDLHVRQSRAEAEVRSVAPAHLTVGIRPSDVEPMRLEEHLGISVRPGVREKDPVSGEEGVSSDLCLGLCVSEEVADRGGEPDDLVGRVVDQIGFGTQALVSWPAVAMIT